MVTDLEHLIEKSKRITMTPDEAREQRQSFAYGNTHIENDLITREMIAEADRQIEQGRPKE